ncbi:enolase C-terminal domain-like protein [Gimesia sp.]|uniref:enolase C-terminal domain-like protein n=1 Tax=Gimesia sp. TaxID=2024833 RepID=UPI000C356ACA|nr:enolase C-terminal domain-like protein [Gimesia sp.]MAX36511.1 dipeptide epimerase [Gimesia sp.]HBL46566.1 dipeptide epimerase [Planctomycetaceae bacterium]|tara:strand:- start:25787 stop:26980 length:1194 start_codon:yes stop_codon:yes gene_type:complete
MRIARLSAYQVAVPLRRKIKHASFSRSESQSIIVRCELDDGTTGWGESVPREYVTGESVLSVFSQYEMLNAQSPLSSSWNTLPELHSLLQQWKLPELKEAPPEYVKRGCFGNAARCAIELSLLDAATRAMQTSLSAIFTHLDSAQELLQPQKSVRYSAVLTSMRPIKQYSLAALYRLTGFQHCKVKVGLPGSDDRALLKRIRSIMGRKMDLRVDANEAWTREILDRKTEQLASFRISAIEQPVRHTDITSLKNINRLQQIPVMLDESLCSMDDAETAISEGYCNYFNLRISKLGGLIPTLLIAQRARQAGFKYQLGCQVGETGILSAAGRHFAAAVCEIAFLEGSFDRYLLTENIINEEISFGRGGLAPALSGPGLGITVNEERLRLQTRKQLQLIS